MNSISNKELQWSSVMHRPLRHDGPGDLKARESKLTFLEDLIAARLGGFRPLIVPSGRAALGLAIQALGLGRGNVIAAPRWSSACVWGTIGRFACPTLNFADPVDAALVVHKYGYVERFSGANAPIIEDSCDSLFTEPTALFANAGVAELVSLPKIFGTYAGGLLFLKNEADADRLRPLTRQLGPLNEVQGYKRWLETGPEVSGPITWDHMEFQNFAADLPTLESIASGVTNWDDHAEVINRRLAILHHQCPDLCESSPFHLSAGRLPCVLPIPIDKLHDVSPSVLPIRRMNTSGHARMESFASMALLPLHGDFSDTAFEKVLDELHIRK